jgi:thymidine kinase
LIVFTGRRKAPACSFILSGDSKKSLLFILPGQTGKRYNSLRNPCLRRNMKHHTGSVEVITGSMFSGKTDELIRRLRRATIARQKVQVFKPVIDDRYAMEKVTSHAGSDYAALPIKKAWEILDHLDEDTTVVAIDEAQFFGDDILGIVQELADRRVRVIIAGLDTDFRGEPFGPMPVLMAQAERVDKLYAICMICGEAASRTQRLINGEPANYDDPVVVVGAAEMYEARCRGHHEVPRKPGLGGG